MNRNIYITTASGRHFYYEDMEGSDIIIEDIAFALSRMTRYCGHTPQFEDDIYSVGQHSVLMTWHIMLIEPQLALPTLLHDASEFAFGDMPGPLKSLIPEYRKMADWCDRIIERKFGLTEGIFEHPLIKRIDVGIRHNEADAVCTGANNLCVTLDHPEGISRLQNNAIIEPWRVRTTYERFMGLYERLHDSQNR